MSKPPWAKGWAVGVRVWIERNGRTLLGEGRAELLEAIGSQHSITAAAKAAGMSYRRAWTLINEVNQAAGEPLVRAVVGGKQGGGAQLTEHGRLALEVYTQLYGTLRDGAAGVLRRAIDADPNAAPCVHLFAAISLQEAIGQILADYSLIQPLVRVRAVYGASNELADHVIAGSPADLLIAAEPSEIDRLDAEKKTVRRSRTSVALNALAVIAPQGSNLRKRSDLLSPRVQRIALAEPVCPLGKYSVRYLQSIGLYDRLLPKMIHVDNSRAVLSAISSGAADAGIAFVSDAARAPYQMLFRVPASQVAAEYVAALLRGGLQQEQARALLNFITSSSAAKCLRRCGLRPARSVRAAGVRAK